MKASSLIKTVLISAVLSALGLAYVIYRVGKPGELLLIREIKPFWFGLAIFSLVFSYFSGSHRLKMFATRLGHPIDTWQALKTHLLGMFSAAITPSGSGNAPLIAYQLEHYGLDRHSAWSAAISTFAHDTLYFSWSMPIALIILHFSKIYQPGLAVNALAVFAIAVTSLATYIFSFRLKLLILIVNFFFRGPLERFKEKGLEFTNRLISAHEVFSSVKASWYLLVQLFSALAWWSFFATIFFITKGFGLNLSIFATEAYQSFITALSFAIPTPGGSGFFELGISPMLSSANPDNLKYIPAVILLWRLITYYSTFIIGPVLGGNLVLQKMIAAQASEAESGK